MLYALQGSKLITESAVIHCRLIMNLHYNINTSKMIENTNPYQPSLTYQRQKNNDVVSMISFIQIVILCILCIIKANNRMVIML